MKKKILFIILLVSTLVIIGIPLLLNISWISEGISWYFSGLRTPDYKMTYISLIGGIIGVWMTVGTTLLVQSIFDSREEEENEKVIRQIVHLFLLEEINKNHKAMTTCDSGRHKHIAKDKTVLQLVKDNEFTNISHFTGEFSLSNWVQYSKLVLDTDKEAFMIISKLYDCYEVISKFNIARYGNTTIFQKSGIYEYEKIYKRFEKRFGNLIVNED